MGNRTVNADNLQSPIATELNNVVSEQESDKTEGHDHPGAPEEVKEEIVIKQVPVDGICGGY